MSGRVRKGYRNNNRLEVVRDERKKYKLQGGQKQAFIEKYKIAKNKNKNEFANLAICPKN